MWATQAARSLRLATQATPGAVCVAGPERLRVLEPLLRYATALRAMARRRRRRAAAGQRLGAGAARRAGHAGSEPGKGAGFSGEGAVLHLVAGGDANEDAAFVSTLLAFEPRIDIAQLAAGPVARRADRVRAGRAGVFRPGGFDLAAGAYFHRPLPVQAGLLHTLLPGWRVRASWWPAAAQQLPGSRWAPSPRKTVAPAPGTPSIKARAGRASTLAVRMFLDPSMRLEPEHDLEPDRTPRGAARGRRRRRRGGYRSRARWTARTRTSAPRWPRPCRHRACSTRRGRRPGLALCWPHWVNPSSWRRRWRRRTWNASANMARATAR